MVNRYAFTVCLALLPPYRFPGRSTAACQKSENTRQCTAAFSEDMGVTRWVERLS